MYRKKLLATFTIIILLTTDMLVSSSGASGPTHAIAMHGNPKFGAGYKHFDYVNPLAAKGGKKITSETGTFDSLNPFILQGNPANISSIYDSLMVQSVDEAFTLYCLLCESIETPKDRSWVEFTLRNDAFWHDGKQITVNDVIFSFNILQKKGRPFYRFYYGGVSNVSQTGPRKVKFTFSGKPNPELPLILGDLTILPKHYWESRDFSKASLDPPLGSGPYRIFDVKPGRSVTLKRVNNYWGKNHPAKVGFDNIDTIRIDYFRDRTVAREAFKGGSLDLWLENSAKEWATAFNVPPVRDGRIIKKDFFHKRTAGMQGFVFNIRKSLFMDRRVRKALNLAWDFEWYNKNLAYSAYTRTDSYFDNSELGSRGLLSDADQEEQSILYKYKEYLPKELFKNVYIPPSTDGTGSRGIRNNLKKAGKILKLAGWKIQNSVLVNSNTKEPFKFEILLVQPAFERMALPFARNLKRLGIQATVRIVDSAQYQARIDNRDFDMIVGAWGQSQSPGNEQRDFWSSRAAIEKGSRNSIGINSKVIDELIELVITAQTRESLVQRTRALDRVLLWGHYVIPHFHLSSDRIAYWDKFGKPKKIPVLGAATNLSAWWVDTEKEAALIKSNR